MPLLLVNILVLAYINLPKLFLANKSFEMKFEV